MGAKQDIIECGTCITSQVTNEVLREEATIGQNNTTCKNCVRTCHLGCTDTVSYRCYVFHNNHYATDSSETMSNAHGCIQCGCSYKDHHFAEKRYWTESVTETKTNFAMLSKQNSAKEREEEFEKEMLELENKNLVLQIDCMVAHLEV